jgi:hypothetical protein
MKMKVIYEIKLLPFSGIKMTGGNPMAHLSPFFSVGIIGHAREDGLSWDQGH